MRRLDPYRMTFDQLQRYRLAAELIDFIRDRKPLLILDAGSREGFLRRFLSEDKIVNLDRTIFTIDNFVQGNILQLPYPDGAMDIALALDVLEHVPPEKRPIFLGELARVTRDLFIVGSPFKNEKVEEAEKLANEFCLKVTGKENEFLIEHLTEGLPRLGDALEWAKEHNFQRVVLSNAYLYRWLAMMCLNSYLSNLADPWDVIFAANDFYHQRFYEMDNALPGYRKIILFSKSGKLDSPEIEKKLSGSPAEEIDSGSLISFMGKLAELIDSEKDKVITKLNQEKEAAQRELKSEVKKLTGIIDEKTQVNAELRKELDSEVEKLTGIIDDKNQKLDSEIKKLTGLIDGKSREIVELSRWANALQAELEGIKSSLAYKIYQKTLGKFKKSVRESSSESESDPPC